MPKDLESWLAANELLAGTKRKPITGGCISQAWLIESGRGERLFVKYKDDAPRRFYESEAESLEYLSRVGTVTVPKVLGYGESFIALEYIYPGVQQADFWEILGYQLAHLHEVMREQFGFVNDNYCGSSVQKNSFHTDGFKFFSEYRLMYQAQLAAQQGKLTADDLSQIERLCSRIEALIPSQPASLLHGDLWSGNVHSNSKGEPVFIDPAIYFSWGEIDIAMTKLFGGFPDQFYSAYQEVRPLEHGWQDRLALYNLYPLLNHLNLFGDGYLSSIRSTLKRFS